MTTTKLFAAMMVAATLMLPILTQAKEVTFMTYNAENLFDTLHDQGKKDYTYLPLAVKQANPEYLEACRRIRNRYYRENCLNFDWTQEVMDQKLKNLGRVIKVAAYGSSPDFVILQEVENINALKQLRDKALSQEGYKELVLIEGPDSRGIDVAIMSKYPLAEKAKYHQVEISKKFKTRGILEATFKIGKRKVTVLANHWPSQQNSDETRYKAAKRMAEVVANTKYPVIAGGDFNTKGNDNPHGINEFILNENRNTVFYDAEFEAFGERRGTHHYNGWWNSLDRLFLLQGSFNRGCRRFFGACFSPDWSSVEIVKKDWMLKDISWTDDETGEVITYRGVPNRFNPQTGEGFSDHLPVVMKVNIK